MTTREREEAEVLPAETIACWRVNYGLDRGPHALHDAWSAGAPPGAVLALRAAVLEIERLRAWIPQAEARQIARIADMLGNMAAGSFL